ncbi:SdrD B-like domain-containing protein [Corynebacterium nasicanis]|uniref:SdrD B-like domain-containing protein n=1 Tax=Corynebacterium nasicanis TaxID=1448267 RepID=A0ABW1QDE2_9CORY
MLTVLILLVSGLVWVSEPAVAQGRGQITLDVQPTANSISATEIAQFEIRWACSTPNTTCDNVVITAPLPEFVDYPDIYLTGNPVGVASSGNFSGAPVYDARTRTLRWTMNNPLPAGSSGSLFYRIATPPGTVPNGAKLVLEATATSTNSDTVVADNSNNPVVVRSQYDFIVDKRRTNANAAPLAGADITYSVWAGDRRHMDAQRGRGGNGQLIPYTYQGARRDGIWNLMGITIRDTLPEGAEFVSASGGGVYDPATHTVTWPPYDYAQQRADGTWSAKGDTAAGVPPYYLLTVRYPLDKFPAGQPIENTATATAHPIFADDVVVTASEGDISTPIADPGTYGGSFTKATSSVGNRTVNRGALNAVVNTFGGRNTSPVPLEVRIDDHLPCALTSPAGPGCQTPGMSLTSFAWSADTSGTYELRWETTTGASNGSRTFVLDQFRSESFAPTLQPGEIITSVYVRGTLPAGAVYSLSLYGTALDSFPVERPAGFRYQSPFLNGDQPTALGEIATRGMWLENCVTDDSGLFRDGKRISSFAGPDAAGNSKCGYNRVAPDSPTYSIDKQELLITPGGQGTLSARLVASYSPMDVHPVVTELLPKGFHYVPESLRFPNNTYRLSHTNAIVEVIPNFAGTGRELVRISWPDEIILPKQTLMGLLGFTMGIQADRGLAAGSYVNEIHMFDKLVPNRNDPLGAKTHCSSGVQTTKITDDRSGLYGTVYGGHGDMYGCGTQQKITVVEQASIDGTKFVKGSLDTDWQASPNTGLVEGGKNAQYRLDLYNSGSVEVTDLVLYDILPHVGDTGVLVTDQQRGSDWSSTLAKALQAVPGATISYSASSNPCRPEVLPGNTGCTDDWNTNLGAVGRENVKAVKIAFGGSQLKPNETWSINLEITAEASRGGIAWNSFAVTGKNAKTGQALIPVEPAKVGLQVPVDVDVIKTADDNGVYRPGDEVIWNIEALNHGPGWAADLLIADKLPAGVTYQDSTVEYGYYDDAGAWVSAGAGTAQYDPATGRVTLDRTLRPANDRDTQRQLNVEVAATVGDPAEGEPAPAVGALEPTAARLTITTKVNDGTEGQRICNDVRVETKDPNRGTGTSQACISVGTTVAGTIWDDVSGEGNIGDAEPRLGDVKVALLDAATGQPVRDRQGQPITALTDDQGNYLLTGVPPGNFTVSFDPANLPEGEWVNTFDIDGTDTPHVAAVTVGTSKVENVNFGVTQPATIGDFVWVDVNGNGVFEEGEKPLEGVTVRLLDATGAVLATTTTDVDGKYTFPGLTPGTYQVRFDVPAGYAATTGPDSVGANPAAVKLEGRSSNLDQDLGLRGTGVIGDTVFIDDDSKAGIPGVTVTLLDAEGNTVDEQITDADGKYRFTNLLPGVEYTVRVADPPTAEVVYVPSGHDMSRTLTLPPEAMENLDQDFGFRPRNPVRLDVAVQAAATYNEGYTWKVTKTADKEREEVAVDATVTPAFTITATPEGPALTPTADSEKVTATVTVTNPEASEVTITDLQVTGEGLTCEPTTVAEVTVLADGSEDVDFTCTGTVLEGKKTVEEMTEALKGITLTATATQAGTGTPVAPATGQDADPELTHDPAGDSNATVDVVDTFHGGDPRTIGTARAEEGEQTFPFTAPELKATAGRCDVYTNEVALQAGGKDVATDKADYTLCASGAAVPDATVEGTFDRIYGWDIEKETVSAVTVPIDGSNDRGVDIDYRITTTETPATQANHTYGAVITVANPDADGITPMLVNVTATSAAFGKCEVLGGETAQIDPQGTSRFVVTCNVPDTYTGDLSDTLTWEVARADASGQPVISGTETVTGTEIPFNKTVIVSDPNATTDTREYTWVDGTKVYTWDLTWDGNGQRIMPNRCVSVVNTAQLAAVGDQAHAGQLPASASTSDQFCNAGLSGHIFLDEERNGRDLNTKPVFTGEVTVRLMNEAGEEVATVTTTNGLFNFGGVDAGTYYIEFDAPDGHGFSPQVNTDGDRIGEPGVTDAGSEDGKDTTVRTPRFTIGGANDNTPANIDAAVFPLKPLELRLDVDAEATYGKAYEWSLTKKADPTQALLREGDKQEVTYEVTVDAQETLQVATVKVTGELTLKNPERREVNVGDITFEPETCRVEGDGVDKLGAGEEKTVTFTCEVEVTGTTEAEIKQALEDLKITATVGAAQAQASDDDAKATHDDAADKNAKATLEDVLRSEGEDDVVREPLEIDAQDAPKTIDYQVTFTKDDRESEVWTNEAKIADATAEATVTLDREDPEPGAVTGVIWNDANRDGVIDADEAGIPGIELELVDADGNPVATATTGPDGSYTFADIPAGDYTVRVLTVPDNMDLVSDPAGTTNPQLQARVTVEEGKTTQDQNFGFAGQVGAVSGTIWDRGTGNPLAGVTVTLLNELGEAVGTVTTGPDGTYSFGNVPAGNYTIEVAQPAGWDLVDSPQGGLTTSVTVTAGEEVTDQDYGFQKVPPVGNITGTIWNDRNQDALRDLGEAGLEGWMVDLLDEDGNVIATTRTDATGNYGFTALFGGTYTIEVHPKAGWLQTADPDGPAVATYTYEVILPDGGEVHDLDFGFYNPSAPPVPVTPPGSSGGSIIIPLIIGGLIGSSLTGSSVPDASSTPDVSSDKPVSSRPTPDAPAKSEPTPEKGEQAKSQPGKQAPQAQPAKRSPLANTGASVIGLVVAALILAAVGTLLVMRRRK